MTMHSTLPAAKAYTTLELKLNIVRALTDAVFANGQARISGSDATMSWRYRS